MSVIDFGKGITADVSHASSADTPAVRYAAWAAALGVSASTSLVALDADDTGFAITLGAPAISGATTSSASFGSEGGFGFYLKEPSEKSSSNLSASGVSRMYGLATLPDVLLTFHPSTDCRSEDVKFQKAGDDSIFTGRIRAYSGQTHILDFALRLNGSTATLLLVAADQPVDVRMFGPNLSSASPFAYTLAAGATREISIAGLAYVVPVYPSHVLDIVRVPLASVPETYGVVKPTAPLYRSRSDYANPPSGKGIGRVKGTTKDKGSPNIPVSERVRLYRQRDGLLIREVWSTPGTGAYSFDYIDELQAYTALSYDHDGNFRAAVADGLTLANGGVELIA